MTSQDRVRRRENEQTGGFPVTATSRSDAEGKKRRAAKAKAAAAGASPSARERRRRGRAEMSTLTLPLSPEYANSASSDLEPLEWGLRLADTKFHFVLPILNVLPRLNLRFPDLSFKRIRGSCGVPPWCECLALFFFFRGSI